MTKGRRLGKMPGMRRTVRPLVRLIACFAFVTTAFAQSVTRFKFTPPVVPETQVNPVLFEATVIGSPASVVFNYNSVDRPMYDDGTHGDVVARFTISLHVVVRPSSSKAMPTVWSRARLTHGISRPG